MQFYCPDRDSVFVCCKVMGFKIIFHGHCWVLLPKNCCDINFAILCLFYTEMIGFLSTTKLFYQHRRIQIRFTIQIFRIPQKMYTDFHNKLCGPI